MFHISKTGRFFLHQSHKVCTILCIKRVKAVWIPFNYTGIFSMGMDENLRHLFHTTVKHQSKHKTPSKDSSCDNSEVKNEIPTQSARKDIQQSSTFELEFQQKKSSIPPHDVQRITPVGRRLELKADILFDELAETRGANKSVFLMAVQSYISKEALYRRGAVEFIYTGLQRMKQFGVERDLMAYKALIQAFPEGKMIPRNIWQVEFMHYPRQQQCGIDLLEEMENNGIIPDDEFGKLLKDRFGASAHVTRKYRRMKYWLPKFKNMNPYPIPFELPTDPVQLALLALKRMCVDSDTKYHIYKNLETDASPEENTYIVSAQSPVQQQLISKHKTNEPLLVEGPYPVFLRTCRQQYFLLRAETDVKALMKDNQHHLDDENDNKLFEWKTYFEEEQCHDIRPVLTVHEQEDSTILGLCITGTSSKSSVVSWIRCLEKCNPVLGKTPVLFKLVSPESEIEAVGNNRSFRELQL